VIKYEEFEVDIKADIEKAKSKAKPQKDEEPWVVQLAREIEDMFATRGRGLRINAEGIAGFGGEIRVTASEIPASSLLRSAYGGPQLPWSVTMPYSSAWLPFWFAFLP
jgi:hypothetical protein